MATSPNTQPMNNKQTPAPSKFASKPHAPVQDEHCFERGYN